MELQQLESLDSKEILILKGFASGMDREEVAQRLGISPKTLRGYLHKIYQKLQIKKLHQAVVWFYKNNYELVPKSGC